jgi:hypothetical protein
LAFLVRFCTQKAQQDLRYEENIDAFSMDGQQVNQFAYLVAAVLNCLTG